MTTWETLYNPGDGPRMRDAVGHIIDGHSWAPGDTDFKRVASDVTAGRLLVVETLDPVPMDGTIAPAAQAAMLETLRLRQEQAGTTTSSSTKTTTTEGA